MTPAILAAALAIADRLIPAFACSADKRPLTSRGFKDASTDPSAVRRMFAHPAATLIGVPTGAVSGVDALDIDHRHGGREWEQTHCRWLPETRAHQTRSGGRHYLFKHDTRVRNSAGRIGPGIDVRGEGGYIVVPPSEGYTVIHEAAIAAWPNWLLQPGLALPPVPKVRPEPPGYRSPISSQRLEGYRSRVLTNLAAAVDGEKHAKLLKAGLLLGGIAAQAGFDDDEAVHWLLDVLPAADDWLAAKRTAEWAVAAGRARPLVLEDRQEYRRPTQAPQQAGART